MLGAFFVVNASAAGKSTPKKEMTQFIDVLTKVGDDGQFPESLSPPLGLPGVMQTKYARSMDSSYALIYEESTGSSGTVSKSPLCVILLKRKISGLDTASQYYRIGLDGGLEKAFFMRGKHDKDGKPVAGSNVDFIQDMDSPEVKTGFKAAMREARAWVRQQTKLAAEKAAASDAPAAAH